MDFVSSPVEYESRLPDGPLRPSQPTQHSEPTEPSGLVPSHGIFIDIDPPHASDPKRPQPISHSSAPTYNSPVRHHRRAPSAPRQVKESLNARSRYVTSEDDGSAQHQINQYTIKQEIGRGSFGAVHLATDQYGEEFAVKEFSKSRLRKRAQSHILRGPRQQRIKGNLSPDDFNSPLHRNPSTDPTARAQATNSIDLIREEIAIMKKLNHPNLVSLIEVLDDPKEDSLYMVLEMCKKGVVMKVGLGETSDPYSDEQCRHWFRDLILGIEYLHAQGIVHRDIKPDNCLLTKDDVLKVVDFGVSEMFEKHSEMLTAKSAGSPAFLPPELCVVKHGGISGKAVDIWSMGVTLYCLRFGRIPFERSNILDLYEAIKSEKLHVPVESGDAFDDLIRRVLEKDPEKRIKMSELREHLWVTRNGTDPLLPFAENTAELVEPPTDEEVNHAITSNMKYLITVMKAVHKFKALGSSKRPQITNSILGEGPSRLSQPPGSIDLSMPSPPALLRQAHSADLFDRRPLEGALVREGVHRDAVPIPVRGGIRPNDRNLGRVPNHGTEEAAEYEVLPRPPPYSPRHSGLDPPMPIAEDTIIAQTPTADRDAFPPFVRTDLLFASEPPRKAQTTDNIGQRGHARDPLEEHLYLYIGPSTYSGVSDAQDRRASFIPDEDDVPIVSESPGAADIDIYETAYRDEIERIRARLLAEGREEEEPVVYLTRRVDAKLLALGTLAGRVRASGEEAIDKVKDLRGLRDGRARVGGISRALRVAAREEYERRKQEKKAKEVAEGTGEEGPTTHLLESEEGDVKQDSKVTTPELEEQRPAVRQSASLFSNVGGKAWEKGKQAKSSFKELYGRARERGSRHSSGTE